MGLPLKTLAGQVIGLGFSLASDIVLPCSYVQPSSAAYNAQTGVVTPTNVTKSVNAMILRIQRKEVDGTLVKFGDERLIIKATEMTGVMPGSDDKITETGSGIVRNVIDFDKDPTGTMFIIHCRRLLKA